MTGKTDKPANITSKKHKEKFEGGGLVLFDSVQQAMRAEKVLKVAGYTVKLVAPPPQMRMGCDLAVEINLVEAPGIERVLQLQSTPYVNIAPLNTGTAPLLNVVKIKDFGRWLMVRAGNMKITYEKESNIIVNISGGGCPDIPYLHAEMIGKSLQQAPSPKEIGFSLCALNLQRAFEECLVLQGEGKVS